jgi:hypothetical protein
VLALFDVPNNWGKVPVQCAHCNSLFFKTLEVRISKASELLYKKRCKRCKRKTFFRRDLLNALLKPLSWIDWQAGQKVSVGGYRAQVFVSEYTRKMSRSSDRQNWYLQQLQHAKEQTSDSETAKTAG